jgi:hypothetical protein
VGGGERGTLVLELDGCRDDGGDRGDGDGGRIAWENCLRARESGRLLRCCEKEREKR